MKTKELLQQKDVESKEVVDTKLGKIKENRVGLYQLRYEVDFDFSKDSKIYLTLKTNEPLKDLLREVVINEIGTTNFEGKSYERYLIRAWVANKVNPSNGREFLFFKDLIDKGQVVINFSEVYVLETVIEKIRKAFNSFLQLANQYHDLTKKPEDII